MRYKIWEGDTWVIIWNMRYEICIIGCEILDMNYDIQGVFDQE